MNIEELVKERKEEFGIHECGTLTTDRIAFSQGVRDLCASNACGHYGRNWSCPPGVGEYEECRAKILSYKNMFVYTTKHDLEDSYDFEGMEEGKVRHGKTSKKLIAALREATDEQMLILSADGCNFCEKCTYPDAPCRFPDQLFPSVESYGVEVYRLAQELGINYINGANTVTYFGCIAYN